MARNKVVAAVEGDSALTGDVMLHASIENYLVTRWPAKSGRSYTTALQILGHFAQAQPDQDLARLGLRGCRKICQDYFDALVRNGYSSTTIHNHQRAVHRFFESLMRRTFTNWEANPATKKKLELPSEVQGESIPASAAEVGALIQISRGTLAYPLVLLCAGAGLRPVAAINRVCRRHLELAGQQPKVWTIEKNVRGAVRLDAWTAAELRAWLADHPGKEDDPLWPKAESMAYREIRRLRAKAELPARVNLEALRKYHTTMCYAVAGMLPQQEAKRNRHSIAIAEREYLDWSALESTTGIRKMGNHLRKLATEKPQKKPQPQGRQRAKTA
ncbi:MAG: hypothetical protein L6R28_15710 [Planctomycetes bacterium]|nr:hypothetical protein [Planctomycetota bacterium]